MCTTVSYTHLDVYKRQSPNPDRGFGLLVASVVGQIVSEPYLLLFSKLVNLEINWGVITGESPELWNSGNPSNGMVVDPH